MRDLLADLNEYGPWREIYGSEDPRMRDQELILRFLALFYEGDSYQKPMVTFLNTYMGKNKNVSEQNAAAMANTFKSAVDLLLICVGNRAFRPVRALNAAVFDSVMVGSAKRLTNGPVTDHQAFKSAYDALFADQDYLDACGRGTASGERVRKRLDLATAAFAPVP
jgi:hypothetical protein